MPFVNLDETQLYYEQTGDGRDLLIISGTGSDLRIPRPTIPHIEDKYRILRYDHRGLGQSTTDNTAVSMFHFADDAAALLTKLGIRQVDVVGISFGGMVAQHLAHRHPQLVRKLVLACTSSGGPTYASADLLELMNLPIKDRQRMWLKMYDSRYEEQSSGDYFVYLLEKLLKKTPTMFPNVASDGLMRQITARSSHDLSNQLHNIPHETFIVGGEHDRIAPPRNLRYLAENLQHAELRFFEGGHSFLLEDDSAWKEIDAFLTPRGDTL